MRKTLILDFDYYEEKEKGLAECFGTSTEDIANLLKKESAFVIENDVETKSSVLMGMIEENEITPGELFTLAAMQLSDMRKKLFEMFMDRMQ